MPSGLLILCSPLSRLSNRLPAVLSSVVKHVDQTLYVQLEPSTSSLWPPPSAPSEHLVGSDHLQRYGQFITNFYSCSQQLFNDLDVRFLLTSLKPGIASRKITLSRPLDVVFADETLSHTSVQKYLKWRFDQPCTSANIVSLKPGSKPEPEPNGTGSETITPRAEQWTIYDNVVLGGTFDRIHVGHKILLTEAILKCIRRLTIGVTVGSMNTGKILWELIEPYDVRCSVLLDFLKDVDDSIDYNLEPISDPFGPSITDPDLQCIVVSEETSRGAGKVNDERRKKNFKELDVHTIKLLPDFHKDQNEEDKVSSSSLRMRSLGTRIRPPLNANKLPSRPYVIGLTGGICSGKSSIAKRLGKLGASLIDCDKLGHMAYLPGTSAFEKICSHFGETVKGEDGLIDRKALAAIVFKDKNAMDQLNLIVWPEIKRLADQQIHRLAEEGTEIIVLEAAVLLEANWQDLVHEIWVSVIPETEAIRRIRARDKVGEEQAKQRLLRQISNCDRIGYATVVFSTFWEPEYTQKQVEKAWKLLGEYLNAENSHYNGHL